MEHYDRQGQPISLLRWAELMEEYEYRRVANNEIGDVSVSTVWMGIDYAWGEGPTILIFETMIFGGPHDQDQYRWPTEAAALAGHDQLTAMVRDEVRS